MAHHLFCGGDRRPDTIARGTGRNLLAARSQLLKGRKMGFLDKVKGTAKQAINPVGMAGERDKIMRINKEGVQTPATVDSMREVGTQFGGGHQIEFDLTVHPEGSDDYQVHVTQSLHDASLR